MLKQKLKLGLYLRSLLGTAVITIALVGATTYSAFTGLAVADSISSQINALQSQNDQNQQAVNSLQLQATSYQDAINQLDAQINAIQQAIVASQNESDSLNQQINNEQVQLDQQKKVLGEDIKAMYLEGDISTLEILASSNNLSDFVNKEVDRSVVQDKVKSSVDTITNLKLQLQQQQTQVNQLLATQQAQRNQLANDENQQSQLLGYNESQQAQYNQQIESNKSQIAALEAEQAAINEQSATSIVAPSGGGTGGNCATPPPWYTGSASSAPNGGYPMNWCDADQDSLTTLGGFPNRECTSFAYWYFTTQESGHSSFYVTGNANQWWYTANRPVDQTPADGAIAVDPSGPYGHVMIVVAVPGESYGGNIVPQGYIDTISMNDDWNGHFFSLQRPSSGFYYIH